MIRSAWDPPPIWRMFSSLVFTVFRRSIDTRLMVTVFSNGIRTMYSRTINTLEHWSIAGRFYLELHARLVVEQTFDICVCEAVINFFVSNLCYSLRFSCGRTCVCACAPKKKSFGWSNQSVRSFCLAALLNRSTCLLHWEITSSVENYLFVPLLFFFSFDLWSN